MRVVTGIVTGRSAASASTRHGEPAGSPPHTRTDGGTAAPTPASSAPPPTASTMSVSAGTSSRISTASVA